MSLPEVTIVSRLSFDSRAKISIANLADITKTITMYVYQTVIFVSHCEVLALDRNSSPQVLILFRSKCETDKARKWSFLQGRFLRGGMW